MAAYCASVLGSCMSGSLNKADIRLMDIATLVWSCHFLSFVMTR